MKVENPKILHQQIKKVKHIDYQQQQQTSKKKKKKSPRIP